MAAIYKIAKKGFLLHAERKAVSGFRLAWEPFIRISESSITAALMSKAIKEVINETESAERVPDPKNWSENRKKFFKNTGLKSLKELNASTTRHCGIDKENDGILFTPSKHAEKPDKGFLYKNKDEAVIVPITASNQDIIAALELAFSRCE